MLGLMTQKQHAAELAALKQEIEALKAQTPDYADWLLRTAEAERYNLPDPSAYAYQADLYRVLSPVLSACQITAHTAAPTPFSVGRLVAGQEPKDIPNHPFELLLNKPNPLDSRFDFLSATIISWMLNGNFYWWLNCVDEYSPPDELWLIPAHMITPIPDGNLYLKGYYYYPGTGAELFLEPWEIAHCRRFNPFSRYVGLSAIESLAILSKKLLGAQEWSARFYKDNNGRLPSILAFEQFPQDEVWNKMKDEFRDAAKKREMIMLRGVGQGGVQWLQNAITQKDQELLATIKMGHDEIWTTLAPGLVSYLSESATEANSRTGESAFERLTVYPLLTMIGEMITNVILPRYPGRPLVGKFKDMRKANEQLLLLQQQEYAKTHTINKINEKFYESDETFDDERGDLLPVQVQASSGVEGKPKAPEANPENTLTAEALDENTPEKRAAILDLERFQRKALKKVGQDIEFTSDNLPADTMVYLHSRLPTCVTSTAVKALFEEIRQDFKPKREQSEIWALVKSIELAVSGKHAA